MSNSILDDPELFTRNLKSFKFKLFNRVFVFETYTIKKKDNMFKRRKDDNLTIYNGCRKVEEVIIPGFIVTLTDCKDKSTQIITNDDSNI